MIENFTFGKITINNRNYEDIKIIGEKIIPWQYTQHHTVTQQDVIEIFEDNPKYIVIGIGTNGLVHVNQDVIEQAEEKAIKLVIEPTKSACNKYNELKQQGKKVDAIIHATC